MAKKKKRKGYLLINRSDGSISQCARCSGDMVKHVLHMNITWTDVGVYKEDLSRAERSVLMKAYPKQCDEVFLCEQCYKTGYKTNEDYLLESGMYNYTSIFAKDWYNTEWVTLPEAVQLFS